MRMKHLRGTVAVLLSLSLSAPALAQAPAKAPGFPARSDDYKDVLEYIENGWTKLSRSPEDCATVVDPKNPPQSVLYVPAEYPITDKLKAIEAKCKIQVKSLGTRITKPGSFDVSTIRPQGLLLLEHPYVVPGGFFNEMYGWDSYFILLGLLRAGKIDLARGMVENFFFEIEHYGAVLNANRGYFLTRSQPPFLSSMVLAVYEAQPKAQRDPDWLKKARGYIIRDHEMWTTAPHLAGNTGLSRYFDFGEGPVPEIRSNGDRYYRDIIGLTLTNPQNRSDYVKELKDSDKPEVGPAYTTQVCEEGAECTALAHYALTADYYKGDRSMRESGFDISFRFGPYSGHTHHFAAVDLNSLLFKTENDLSRIDNMLNDKVSANKWRAAAEQRSTLMTKYFWDEQRGMFFDYDAVAGKRSTYEYATTFYPLWSGAATRSQAEKVHANLSKFEKPGGIVMSTQTTGVQWDYPYGWAPLQLITVNGLRRYGHKADAERVAYRFLETVARNMRRDGTIREKYNVITGSSEANVSAGYRENVIGFGWTNGVFLELLHGLQESPSAVTH
jgi:alpha,alpha-trehalase